MGLVATEPPPPQGAVTAPPPQGGLGMGALDHPIYLPLALGAQGSHLCPAALVVLVGL